MARVVHLLPHPGGGGERYVEMLKAGLSEHHHVVAPLAGSPQPLRAAPALLFRRPLVAREVGRADLVHVHGDMAAILSRRLTGGRPVILTTHGLHFVRRAEGAAGQLGRRLLAAAVHEARRTLCTSEVELAEVVALAGDGARVLLARNGVAPPPPCEPAARAAARAELDLADADVAALFLGELAERKRPLLAARATGRVRAEGAPLVLLIAGDGPQAKALAGLANGGVRVLGYRDDPERLLCAADLFVLPSEREGLSLALLEAMAAGLPPVVADAPGNVEAVNGAGVVVAAGDETALADALKNLTLDGGERARLGAAARGRAQREFRLDRMLGIVRAEYAAALAP